MLDNLNKWCLENKSLEYSNYSDVHENGSIPFMFQYKKKKTRHYNLEENIRFISKFIESHIENFSHMMDKLSLKVPQIPNIVKANNLWETIDEEYIPINGYLTIWETNINMSEYPIYIIVNPNAKENEDIEKHNTVLSTTFIVIRNEEEFTERFKQTLVRSKDIGTNTLKLYSVFEFSLYIAGEDKVLRHSQKANLDLYTKNEIDQSILTMASEIIIRLCRLRKSLHLEYEHSTHIRERALSEFRIFSSPLNSKNNFVSL
jgi:hypothetical protein